MFVYTLQIFYTVLHGSAFPFVNKKGGDIVKGKNSKDKISKKQKLDPIIVVALINGLFALAIALINAFL